MNLVASVIVRNEAGRYLEECMRALAEYCDGIRVLDDHSEDESTSICIKYGARVQQNEAPEFYEHEGRTRQKLFEWTLAANPTHILAIDADEFVADPGIVRSALALDSPVFTLEMEEVWELDGECLCVREDGGWRSHGVPVLYRAPTELGHNWAIRDEPLACGREPYAVRLMSAAARASGTQILHFGWANPAERLPRYERYAKHDGGRYHAGNHLESILQRDVELRARPWPDDLAPLRTAITTKVTGSLV